jgi:hypothetical protein
LGWIEGKTIEIHARYAGGLLDRLPGLARELVALKVDVIVAVIVAASAAAREATTEIPIVMVHAGNPREEVNERNKDHCVWAPCSGAGVRAASCPLATGGTAS